MRIFVANFSSSGSNSDFCSTCLSFASFAGLVSALQRLLFTGCGAGLARNRMKDHLKAEIANTETARTSAARSSGEREWLAPGLARSLEPLLSGLGIELLAAADRERATIRVESVDESVKLFAAESGTDAPSVRLRIERADGRSHERPEQQSDELSDDQSDHQSDNNAIEFEGPGCVWA